MEPFELKLTQVTFEQSDSTLGEGEGRTQPKLDSFSALVHYDASFQEESGSENAAECSDLQDLTFTRSGKDQHRKTSSPPHKYRLATTTTITPAHQRLTNTNTSPKLQQLPLPWEGNYVGDAENQEHFLVNPDDYYLPPTPLVGKVSPEVAAAGLRTLSQVSFNTSAVARHLRKVKGSKRRIAKTTLTSTALTEPRTMPSETQQISSNSGPVTTPVPSASSGDTEVVEDAGDSSFETVAEALRLQWSVIGNANVTPASPEEVARIVAEAEKRLRGETETDSSGPTPSLPPHLSSTADPSASDIPSVESLSSLSSLSSATNDNGIAGADVSAGQPTEICERTPPAEELVRIPAKSITKEVEKTWWFQSKDRPSVSASRTPDETSRVGSDSVRKVGGSGSSVETASVMFSSSGVDMKTCETDNSELTMKDGGATEARHDGTSKTVPFGMGTELLHDLSFNPISGSTPYASPRTQTAPELYLPGQNVYPHAASSQQQLAALSQHHATSSKQTSSPALSQSHPLQKPTTLHPASPGSVSPYASPQLTSPASESEPFIPTTLPLFNPNLVPIPQIGPLFPHKTGGVPSHLTSKKTVVMDCESAGKDNGFKELLLEKLKLEGQLEVLQEEAQSALQERAELQAQLASSQLKLKSGQQRVDDAEKAKLRAELEQLRATRLDHERDAVEVQHMLEEKLEELKAVTEDLYQSQDSVHKLQVRMKELRDDLQAKEVTTQALKSKIAELYVEVQTTLQSKMEADSEARTARNDLVSLVKAKEWYQEQLSTAHEVRAKLQRQLTQLQAQTVSQGSIVERLKLESGRLRQHLRESQERALRDKEQLARHLEAIQQDMMEREAAFQEIQRERLMIEDTFNTQVTTVEEEKSRISNLMQLTSELETQLEQAHNNSKKKQEQIFSLENEHMDLMKKTTLVQEVLVEKEHLLEEANQKLIEVESQLEEFTKTLASKDAELLKLREDKASTEIALKAALQEKESVDKALDTLKGDMGKVEKSFKQMRQELGTRLTELEAVQTRQKTTRDELDRVAHELDIKTRSVDTLTHSHQEQIVLIEQLQAEKFSVEQRVAALKQQLEQAQFVRPEDSSAHQELQTELQETRARLVEAENRLHVSNTHVQQSSSPPLLQETSQVSDEKIQAMKAEKDSLAQRLQEAEDEKFRRETDGQKEKDELREEVHSLKLELQKGKTEFECKVQTYVEQMHQVTEEKQRIEMELEMTQRKFELSSVQQHESINTELQKLMKELESAHLHKQDLERQLHQLQAEKATEIATLQQQLADMQQTLHAAGQQQQDTASLNQQLALDLEKERGRIAGLQQSNSTLKEHMKQLEEALAGRESSLIEFNSLLESSKREREKEQQEYMRRIQDLEVSLKKEKDGGRDLRRQIGTKITENKRLLKQQEAHKKEQGELEEEVEQRQKDMNRLQTDLDMARQAMRDQQEELQSLQREKLALEGELERVKRELADNADRNPVLLEQIQSLEWQVAQRSQEVQAAKEQLALAEQRQANEIESLQRALQDKQDEVDSLQAELTSARQEKADQKSRVSELRSVLKASVQHHKLTKKLNSRKKERGGGDADSREEKATQADMENGVVIPPLPFDMEAVEQLLLDTAVRPLDSKPLDNLSTCLSSLRAEISGLQKQMEVHTTTIHLSTQSWRNVESEVKGLQDVVRSIANTIMDSNHTTSTSTTTVAATDTEIVEDGDIVHL